MRFWLVAQTAEKVLKKETKVVEKNLEKIVNDRTAVDKCGNLLAADYFDSPL